MIELRESTSDELPLFYQMERMADTSEYILRFSLQRHRDVFGRDDIVYLSIFVDQQLCGFFILRLDPDEISVEFRRIVVIRKNSGIGQQAIGLMEDYCRESMKRNRVWLDVFESNHRARHIYNKLGYREFGQTDHDGQCLLYLEKQIA